MDVIVETLRQFWITLATMAPYLLLGFLIAGLLSVFVSARFVERHLGRGLASVVKAAVLGVPLPLCSCGVIPVSASLRRHGAGAGATTSFLISTPQTGVDSILVTYGMLGGVVAVVRPVAAFVSGVIGGFLVSLLRTAPQETDTAAENSDETPVAETRSHKLLQVLRYGFVTLPADIGRTLLVGLVIAAAITALLPADTFSQWFGRGFGAMLVMLVVGIPLYVCATSSVPVAMAMIVNQGITPGAALVFLMTGPATNAATLATVWKLMGRRAAIIYIATVMVTALASGLLLDGLFPDITQTVTTVHQHATEHGVGWIGTALGLALVLVLLPALLEPLTRRWRVKHLERAGPEEGKGAVLEVEGMTCSHCAATVERVLSECAGVDSAAVDLAAGRAVLTGWSIDMDAAAKAVESVGYTARPADDPPGRG